MKTVIKMKLFWGYVSKHRFNCYPGIVKPTDQEMTAIEKSLLFTFPKEKGLPMHACRVTWGKPQGQSGGRRSDGKAWVGDFIVLSLGNTRQGRVSWFRIGSLK